jgi:hypothetical protein
MAQQPDIQSILAALGAHDSKRTYIIVVLTDLLQRRTSLLLHLLKLLQWANNKVDIQVTRHRNLSRHRPTAFPKDYPSQATQVILT